MQDIPELDRFFGAVNADSQESMDFWSCRDAFCELLNSGFVRNLLHRQLDRCLSGTGELVQAGTGSSARITLPNSMQIDILLLDPSSDQDELISYPSHAMIGLGMGRSNASLRIELYRHDASYRNDVFDEHAVPTPHPPQTMGSGDVIGVAAGREMFRLGAASEPMIVVVLRSSPVLGFAWQYDPCTLRPLQAICLDSATYRLYYATRLLRELPSRDSVPSLLRLCQHEAHFVRWSALQALCVKDRDLGEQRLVASLGDPHPSIRASARKALRIPQPTDGSQ